MVKFFASIEIIETVYVTEDYLFGLLEVDKKERVGYDMATTTINEKTGYDEHRWVNYMSVEMGSFMWNRLFRDVSSRKEANISEKCSQLDAQLHHKL